MLVKTHLLNLYVTRLVAEYPRPSCTQDPIVDATPVESLFSMTLEHSISNAERCTTYLQGGCAHTECS